MLDLMDLIGPISGPAFSTVTDQSYKLEVYDRVIILNISIELDTIYLKKNLYYRIRERSLLKCTGGVEEFPDSGALKSCPPSASAR